MQDEYDMNLQVKSARSNNFSVSLFLLSADNIYFHHSLILSHYHEQKIFRPITKPKKKTIKINSTSIYLCQLFGEKNKYDSKIWSKGLKNLKLSTFKEYDTEFS